MLYFLDLMFDEHFDNFKLPEIDQDFCILLSDQNICQTGLSVNYLIPRS